MLLRLVIVKKEKLLYCPNGSIIRCTKEDLKKLLTSFVKPSLFKGTDGYWNKTNANITDAAGRTIAFVDESYKLIVLDPKAFESIIDNAKYISATEYAAKHNRGVAIIKRLCAEGRILGAYKTSSGWLIPENAEYPTRKNQKD